MYFLECDDEWNQIHPSDLWVYNKFFLSRVLGYTCGPAGTTVPKPDFYFEGYRFIKDSSYERRGFWVK